MWRFQLPESASNRKEIEHFRTHWILLHNTFVACKIHRAFQRTGHPITYWTSWRWWPHWPWQTTAYRCSKASPTALYWLWRSRWQVGPMTVHVPCFVCSLSFCESVYNTASLTHWGNYTVCHKTYYITHCATHFLIPAHYKHITHCTTHFLIPAHYSLITHCTTHFLIPAHYSPLVNRPPTHSQTFLDFTPASLSPHPYLSPLRAVVICLLIMCQNGSWNESL